MTQALNEPGQAQDGARVRTEEIYKRHQELVMHWARMHCGKWGRPDMAEDVAAHVWLVVWGHIHAARQPRNYLYVVTRREAGKLCAQEVRQSETLPATVAVGGAG